MRRLLWVFFVQFVQYFIHADSGCGRINAPTGNYHMFATVFWIAKHFLHLTFGFKGKFWHDWILTNAGRFINNNFGCIMCQLRASGGIGIRGRLKIC